MPGWLDLAATRQPAFRLDTAFYDRVRAERSLRPSTDFVIPARSGRAFEVRGGQIFRIVQERGPQIGTIAFWNARDKRENFSGARTMAAEACFISSNTRLWADVPWFRPMATCLADTIVTLSPESDCHHHSVGSHCSAETIERRFGAPGSGDCHQSLLAAIAPFELAEADLHDSITVNQKTHLDPFNGGISITASDAKPGDFIEFYAEMDLLVAIAVCPFGNGTSNPTGADADVGLPLKVEMYDSNVTPRTYAAWTDWRPDWQGHWVPPEPGSATR
jgi:uncharacterized protein YcgI (DUF1989 family)